MPEVDDQSTVNSPVTERVVVKESVKAGSPARGGDNFSGDVTSPAIPDLPFRQFHRFRVFEKPVAVSAGCVNGDNRGIHVRIVLHSVKAYGVSKGRIVSRAE